MCGSSMVVKILHGQEGSVYTNLLRGRTGVDTASGPKAITPNIPSTINPVGHVQSASDAAKVSGTQAAAQVARASTLGEAVVTSVRSTRSLSPSEKISEYKEAKQTANGLAKKLDEEPGSGMQAHNLNNYGARGAMNS